LNSQYLEVKTEKGFIIKLDIYSDLEKTLSQLKLLLKEIGEGRMEGLKYIDARLLDKAYVCYKDAKCAQETIITVPNATSTQIN